MNLKQADLILVDGELFQYADRHVLLAGGADSVAGGVDPVADGAVLMQAVRTLQLVKLTLLFAITVEGGPRK